MTSNQEQLDKNIKENWLAGIGVRKPYTVFVCIMAIIILGVFAFTKMSVDLFPSMNLPYAVVVISPNTSYVTTELQDLATTYTGTDEFKQKLVEKIVTNAGEYYTDTNQYNLDQYEFGTILQTKYAEDDAENQVALMAAMQSAATKEENPNLIAKYYLEVMGDSEESKAKLQALSAEILWVEVLPSAETLEKLTNDATQAVSSVTGVKSTNSTTMLSVGVVMLTLEYNSDATVDLTELNMAFENLGLDSVEDYGLKYSKQILKIDPSLLPVMYVTVSYEGKDQAWFESNVLDKISTTVGVGTVTSNIESTIEGQDHDQAWQNSSDGLVETYSIQIQKTSNAVTTEVCANVIVTLDKIKAENAGFTYDVTSSQGEYINETVGSVGENLVVGGLLALLILFLFLRSLKMTLAIGISIPLALVGTFVIMYFMGINLNIISMSGLALAVGMLVDNSVVVLENIYRLRSKGFPLKDACIKGASQIMLAMLASSLTTICVFFPMFFLEGLVMEMFTDLVWVVILSLLCSFVVAVMFLPSIVSTFKINPKTPKSMDVAEDSKLTFWQKVRLGWRKFTTGANNVFDKVLRFAINKKWLTVFLAVVLFAGSACLLLINGFILIPSTDEGSLTVSATLNSAGQNISASNKKEILAQPLYEKVVEVLGSDLEKCVVEYDSGSNVLSNGAQMSVEIKLKDKRSITTGEASEKLFKAFQSYDKKYYDDIDVSASSMASSLVSSDVAVTLTVDADDYSTAFDTLGKFGTAMEAKFADQIEELNIRSVVYESYEAGVQQIVKNNGKYAATITIKANASADTNKIQSLMNQYLDELMHSDQFKDSGVSVLGNGMQDQLDDSYSSMGVALIVGFLLIYLVMVAIFQSFLMPFIILICVPLGFTGAFLLLAMCGMPLSIPALIGLLILMGVVINNGILAVDYTNQARRDGLSVKEALVSAMHTRMRPIFMTALTTILAMVPMAFGWSLFNPGGSSAIMQPLAVVSIGGLLFGTVTTLIVVPAFYAIFCRDKKVKNETTDQVALSEITEPTQKAEVKEAVAPVAKTKVKATKSARTVK